MFSNNLMTKKGELKINPNLTKLLVSICLTLLLQGILLPQFVVAQSDQLGAAGAPNLREKLKEAKRLQKLPKKYSESENGTSSSRVVNKFSIFSSSYISSSCEPSKRQKREKLIQDVNRLINDGLQYFKQSNYTEAFELFKIAIDQLKNYAYPYHVVGSVYLEIGDFENAIAFLENGNTINNKNAEAYFNLGLAYYLLNQNNKAEKAFKRATKLKKNYTKAIHQLGWVCYLQGENRESLKFLNKAMKATWNKSFNDYFEKNNKHVLNEYALYDRDFLNYDIGIVYGHLGKWEKAIEHYKKAKHGVLHYRSLLRIGLIHMNNGKWQEALEANINANKHYSGDPEIPEEFDDIDSNVLIIVPAPKYRGSKIAYNNIGVCYYNLNKPQKALRAYKQAINIDSEFSIPYKNIDLIYQNLGLDKKEVKAFEREIAHHRTLIEKQYQRLMQEIDNMHVPYPKFTRKHFHEGVIMGILNDEKDAKSVQKNMVSPLSGKRFEPGTVIAFGSHDTKNELMRAIIDNQYITAWYRTAGRFTLNNEKSRKLINNLNGKSFNRLFVHSNGATIAYALIKRGIIEVKELHILGGDRSLVFDFGLRSLSDVNRIIVWNHVDDPVPYVSSTPLSFSLREVALYLTTGFYSGVEPEIEDHLLKEKTTIKCDVPDILQPHCLYNYFYLIEKHY